MTTVSTAQRTDWSALNRKLTDARDNGAAYRAPRSVHSDARGTHPGAPREPGGVVLLRPR